MFIINIKKEKRFYQEHQKLFEMMLKHTFIFFMLIVNHINTNMNYFIQWNINKQWLKSKDAINNWGPFCKEIVNQDPELFMASFDIHSLFTNIPLDETIDICVDIDLQ